MLDPLPEVFRTVAQWGWSRVRQLEMYIVLALSCLYDISIAGFTRKGQKSTLFFEHLLDRYYFSCIIDWIMSSFTCPGQHVLDCYAGTAMAGVACMGKNVKYTGLLGIIKISLSCRSGEGRRVPPPGYDQLAKYLVWRKVKCNLQRFAYYV